MALEAQELTATAPPAAEPPQFPVNFGGRFSMNADTASTRSSDWRNPEFQTAT